MLNEGKQVGILYHFTNILSVIRILKHDRLEASGAGGKYQYVSFTRDKFFYKHETSGDNITSTDFRIVIDGDKLSNRFKITPYNDNSTDNWSGSASYSHTNKQLPDSERAEAYLKHLDYDEKEERVEGDIRDIRDFIISIDIISMGNYYDHDKENIKNLYTICKQSNIKLNQVDEKKIKNTAGYSFNSLEEDTVPEKDMNLNSLKLKDTLNPKIWKGKGILVEDVHKAIMAVAEDFFKTLKVEVPVEDIILTGSLANYNWSTQSDVDIHLLINFDQLYETMKTNDIYDKEEFMTEYFTGKKYVWNKGHNMKIYGHEVEVYVQDVNEEHVSTGVYSVLKREWIQTPSHVESEIDMKFIKRKSKQLMNLIDKVIKKEDTKEADKLKEKLKNFRQRGLDEDGEMSNSNLIYKVLRRMGYIDRLYDFGGEVFDKHHTLK